MLQKPPLVRTFIISAALVLLGVAIGAGGFYWYSATTRPVTTFDECVKANGSQVTLMYPGTCTTKNGKTFTQPLTDEEKKRLIPPTETPEEPFPTSRSSAYTCPKGEWVDCMPGPSSEGIRWECTQEFLTWAKANCPGFKGAAL